MRSPLPALTDPVRVIAGKSLRTTVSEDEDADELRQEIEELEARIDELTSFRMGAEMTD